MDVVVRLEQELLLVTRHQVEVALKARLVVRCCWQKASPMDGRHLCQANRPIWKHVMICALTF